MGEWKNESVNWRRMELSSASIDRNPNPTLPPRPLTWMGQPCRQADIRGADVGVGVVVCQHLYVVVDSSGCCTTRASGPRGGEQRVLAALAVHRTWLEKRSWTEIEK